MELTIQVDIASPSGTLVGLRLFVFRTFFYKLWGIDLKFCIWLCNHMSQTKFVFPGILSNFESVMPLFGHRIIVLSWRSYSVAFAVLLFFNKVIKNEGDYNQIINILCLKTLMNIVLLHTWYNFWSGYEMTDAFLGGYEMT